MIGLTDRRAIAEELTQEAMIAAERRGRLRTILAKSMLVGRLLRQRNLFRTSN